MSCVCVNAAGLESIQAVFREADQWHEAWIQQNAVGASHKYVMTTFSIMTFAVKLSGFQIHPDSCCVPSLICMRRQRGGRFSLEVNSFTVILPTEQAPANTDID